MPSLDYGSSPAVRVRRRRRPWRGVVGVGALLLAVVVLPRIAVRRVECRVDGVTGTMCWTTFWIFGNTSGPRTDVSALEKRLNRSGIAWTPAEQDAAVSAARDRAMKALTREPVE